MKPPRTEIRVRREVFRGNQFEFLLTHFHGPPGVVSRVQMSLERLTKETDMLVPEPTFTLQSDEAQALLDELWRTGLRPTVAVNEQSALPFISAHLEDMRRLVFQSAAAAAQTPESKMP